ncbi:hypothetical protein LCGC14_2784070 [marine sediment metagenome]|uniref:Uncharacterized protein n=1 Tax=marine sediment metagenome TaxID=412755 RepID=A0A0F9B150_9ZZZZ
MAQLHIIIDLDNDALNDDNEIARILTVIASRYDEARTSGKWENAHDINGNPVAKFKVDKEAAPSFD